MPINLTAPINSLGYGYVGLNVLISLEKNGAEPALWPIGPIDAAQEYHEIIRKTIARQAEFDYEAPSLRIYHQFDLAQHVGRGPHAAMPIFELNRFNQQEKHHLHAQHIIFSNSNWASQVLVDNGIDEDFIRQVPLGVDSSLFKPGSRGEDRMTRFLNIGKWEVRKGHDVLVEAFNAAFEECDDVELVMHCHNPCFQDLTKMEAYNEQWERLYKTSRLASKISITNRRFGYQNDVVSLMNSVDCGVFPSRAEGWNMEALEMLACGKEVILTNCSAHTEYASKLNSRLIEVDNLEDAYDGIWFSGQGQWAAFEEPQLDQLVEHLRAVHKKKQAGQLQCNNNGVATARSLTWDRTAQEIMSCF